MSIFNRNRKANGQTRPEQVFGLPSRCPECGKPGYLDQIDLVDRVMYQHCPWCSTNWQTREADIPNSRPAASHR